MTSILYSLLIVGALGLICSAIIIVTSHFLGVKQDERTVKIRECLPGVNCGACGFAGCDSYAQAIADGKCALNLCIPGKAVVVEKLTIIVKQG